MTVQQNEEPIVGINIVPLVDIALVLLIIFMVSSTLLLSPSIRVDLPKAQTGQSSRIHSIHLTIGKNGALQVQGRSITEGQLEELFRQNAGENPSVLLHADKAISHGAVIRIIDLARSAGLNRFAFMVEKGK